MTFRERLVQFGEDTGLSGILTVPNAPDGAAPGALLYNAGIVHRIGAHRLNVKLARRLAAAGVASLRFDLSGLGDSTVARVGRALDAQSVVDIRAAADALAKAIGPQARRLVAIGMCSGADNAYCAALAEERLIGLVLLDPYAYESGRSKLERMAAKAIDPERWKRAIARAVDGAQERPSPPVPNPADSSRPFPSRKTFGTDLQSLTSRGVDILVLYTAYVREQLTRPEHFFEVFSDFEFGGRLHVEVDGSVDHTYTEIKAQAALFERIAEWMAQRRTHA